VAHRRDAHVPSESREDRGTAAVFAHYRHGIKWDSSLTGTLDRNELPGEIRSAYKGASALASPHCVLDVGADPAERARFSVWMAAFGLVVVAVGVTWAVAELTGSGPLGPSGGEYPRADRAHGYRRLPGLAASVLDTPARPARSRPER
jgi:hypothetical protein